MEFYKIGNSEANLNSEAFLITSQEPYFIEFYDSGLRPKPVADLLQIFPVFPKQFFSEKTVSIASIEWWTGCLIISKRVKNAIEELVKDYRQQEIFYDRQHSFFCIQPPCLDINDCDIDTLRARAEKGLHIFRLDGSGMEPIFVSETFKSRIQNAGFSSFSFKIYSGIYS